MFTLTLYITTLLSVGQNIRYWALETDNIETIGIILNVLLLFGSIVFSPGAICHIFSSTFSKVFFKYSTQCEEITDIMTYKYCSAEITS